MDFRTEKTLIENSIKIWNKQAFDESVSGYEDEFIIIKIDSNEIFIESKQLKNEGISSPHIIIKNSNNLDYPFNVAITYDINTTMELTEPTIMPPTKSLRRTLRNAREFIINDIL